MRGGRQSVRAEAERAVDYFGLSGPTQKAVETLTDDPLFQELALARRRAMSAHRVTVADDADGLTAGRADDVDDVVSDLSEMLRDRSADLLVNAIVTDGGTA